MNVKIRVEGSAQAELRSVVAWYEERRAGLGGEFPQEAQRTIEIIQEHPLIGGAVPHVSTRFGARRILLRRFPFSIVYRLLANEIQTVAFAHTSRRPGYWMHRARA